MKSFSQLPLLPESFEFLGGTGPSPLVRCELSGLLCYSFLLSSYLCTTFSCPLTYAGWNERRTPSAGSLTHILLDCPTSEPLRRAIFGTTSSIFDIWSRSWG